MTRRHPALCLLLLYCSSLVASAWAEQVDANLLQMLYLRNFIDYSSWPEQHGPTSLAIVGAPTLQSTLTTMQQQHAFPVDRIRYCDNGACTNGATVVFIGQGVDDVEQLLHSLAEVPVLTVSNQPNFIDHGGIIGLIRRNHRLRFEVNLDAAHRANIHISGELLQMATRIIGNRE